MTGSALCTLHNPPLQCRKCIFSYGSNVQPLPYAEIPPLYYQPKLGNSQLKDNIKYRTVILVIFTSVGNQYPSGWSFYLCTKAAFKREEYIDREMALQI